MEKMFLIQESNGWLRAQTGWKDGEPRWQMLRAQFVMVLYIENSDILARTSDAIDAQAYRVAHFDTPIMAATALAQFIEKQKN